MTPNPTITLGAVEVPRIGLGTNRLRDSQAHRSFIVEAARAGVRHIDTAHLYTEGQSEAAIGAALAAGPDGCVAATKGGYRSAAPAVLRAEIEQSLRSLRADAIDLYYLHRVDSEVPLEESLGALADCRQAGTIRHIGISQVTVEQVQRARRVVPITAVQNQYSLSERKHDAVVDHCTVERIVFVPFFPLRGAGGPALSAVAEARGVTPHQIALAWLLQRSPMMLPIPGTLSPAHLRENLTSLQIELGEDEVRALG